MPNLKKSKKSNLISVLLKSAMALLFALLLLTVLPAAMPDSADPPIVTDRPFDGELPDIDQSIRPGARPHLIIVYPEREAWGEEQARAIESRLSARFHAHFIVISDSDYLKLDAETLLLYKAEPSLTVSLGIGDLLEEPYLEVLERLGADGLEISRREDRIDIVSASSERISEGIGLFFDEVEYNGSFSIGESLFLSDLRPSAETDFVPDIISDGPINILTFSYIDTNSYTLRAIEGIVAQKKPDLVIFNGNVDGSARTRHELAVMWQGIADALKKTDTPWCFTPGELTGGLPRITVCQVISSFEGCIKKLDGRSAGAYALTVANSAGIVTASIYVADTFDGNSALCERIEADEALYARASDYKRAVISVMPAVSAQLAASAEDIDNELVSDKLTDVYDALAAAKCSVFICKGSPVSPSLIDFEGGRLALCGSVGFDSQGPGGRFDYNNSLRCAVMLTVEPHRAEYSDAALGTVLAADYGLNKR